MKHAETVTFGGAGLDRVAELRGDTQAIATLRTDQATGNLVIWRGKILIDIETPALIRVPGDHPVLAKATEAPIFLGLDQGSAVFAHDISAWNDPAADKDAQAAFFDPSYNHHPSLPEHHVFAELRGLMAKLPPLDAELAATAKGILSWHLTHGFCARCGAKTTVTQAGWQRGCPECGGQHFPRTDPVVIMLIVHGNDLLLGRSPLWPEGMYSCLAGFMEPGEPIEAAVRRETYEEAGIRVGQVDYLASQPWPFPSSLMIGCIGHALDKDITLDPKELDDAKWVSREDVAEALSGNNPDLLPARKGSIAHFLIHNWLSDTLT